MTDLNQSILAIVGGAGLGFLLCIAGQNSLNAQQVEQCKRMPDYHRVVSIRSFMGDAQYCMHIRYLAN